MCLAGALLPGLKTMAQDQMGTVSYALPQTTIVIEVEAVRETFHAGPYAKYAQKYLGVEARTEDQSLCHLSAVRMTPTIEADQNYRYYINPGKDALSFLSLTSEKVPSGGSPPSPRPISPTGESVRTLLRRPQPFTGPTTPEPLTEGSACSRTWWSRNHWNSVPRKLPRRFSNFGRRGSRS